MNLRLHNIRLQAADFVLEVNADVRGQVACLFGPSGAGKTTLLDVIAGLRKPTSAFVELGGRVVTDTARFEFVPPPRRGIGYVPQEGALFPHLSVQRNLLYGAGRGAANGGSVLFDHALEVLELRGLEERKPDSLSGGEKQRVALARALLSSPQLLLLDEPLAALDLPLRQRIMPYLQRVRDEFRVPMIYVTHNPNEVVTLCDEVLVIEQGRVVEQGTPLELFSISNEPQFVLRNRP